MADTYLTFKFAADCELCGKPAVWIAHAVGPDECLCPHPEMETR